MSAYAAVFLLKVGAIEFLADFDLKLCIAPQQLEYIVRDSTRGNA